MGGTLTRRGGTVAWALVRRWLGYSFRGGCDPVAERGRDDTGLLAPHPAHPPQQTLCSCGCRRCRRRVSPGRGGAVWPVNGRAIEAERSRAETLSKCWCWRKVRYGVERDIRRVRAVPEYGLMTAGAVRRPRTVSVTRTTRKRQRRW